MLAYRAGTCSRIRCCSVRLGTNSTTCLINIRVAGEGMKSLSGLRIRPVTPGDGYGSPDRPVEGGVVDEYVVDFGDVVKTVDERPNRGDDDGIVGEGRVNRCVRRVDHRSTVRGDHFRVPGR